MRTCILAVLTTLLVAAGCGVGDSPVDVEDECTGLAEHFASCGLTAPAAYAGGCADAGMTAKATEMLNADCGLLSAALSSGKADGYFGWVSLDEACRFNFQCEGNLVCRPRDAPASADDLTPMTNDMTTFCRPAGKERPLIDSQYQCWNGAFCNDSADCLEGRRCVGRSFYGGFGMCLPSGVPGC